MWECAIVCQAVFACLPFFFQHTKKRVSTLFSKLPAPRTQRHRQTLLKRILLFLGEEAHQWLCDHLGHPSLLRSGCLSWCGDSKALSAKWIQGTHLPEVCQCTRKSSFHRDVLKSVTELSFSGALSSDYTYNEWCFGKKACVILPNPSIMLFFVAHPGGHRAWL